MHSTGSFQGKKVHACFVYFIFTVFHLFHCISLYFIYFIVFHVQEILVNRMVKCNAVVITTYQGVRLYRNTLLRHQWDYVILDEGHKIRNPDADITLTCKQVTK